MTQPTPASPIEANPFTEGDPGENFVGREHQLRLFHSSLQGLRNKQPPHMFVAGLNGTGKSSYLYRLAGIANRDALLGAYTTLTENATDYQHISTILRAIVAGLQNIQNGKASATLNDILSDWDRATKQAI